VNQAKMVLKVQLVVMVLKVKQVLRVHKELLTMVALVLLDPLVTMGQPVFLELLALQVMMVALVVLDPPVLLGYLAPPATEELQELLVKM